MTRMTRFTNTSRLFLVLAMAVLVVGCGPDPKEAKIQDLTAENEQLRNELADRDRQLNDALVRENDARDTIDQLNQELAKARTQQPREGEWATFGNFDMISVPGEVLFASGKETLTSNGRKTLASIAADIRARYSDRDIYVVGHTDAQPIRKSNWEDNRQLGAERARSVIKILSDLGVPNEQLILASCGQYRPAVTGRIDEPRNRRVEFYAVRRNTGISEATARSNFAD